MQLPRSQAYQTYIEQTKNVETNLKEATSGETDKALLALVQKRLDSLARKYQYSEEIGAARYKLYELQAVVHYFNGYDDDALDFINQAIEMRGETYAKAEKLKSQLSPGDSYLSKTTNPDKMTKEQRRDQKVGLEGWLALFIVGVGIGIVLGIVNLLGYPSVFNDLYATSEAAPSMVDAFIPALYFEIFINAVIVCMSIWLLILLKGHKKDAKILAIMLLAFSAVTGMIDYAWVSSLYEDFDIEFTAEMNIAVRDVGRSVVGALIWIPYFLVSRRVKRTLTR